MSARVKTIAWDAWCEASMDEDNSARKCIDLVTDAVLSSSGLASDDVVDDVLGAERYAPKVVPMGANPPLFDGMQPDYDGPWLSRVDVAKRLRNALADRRVRIAARGLTDQVILELRAAQHVLGYPDALGDAIEAIAGVEQERVRLWNEVRDLKSSLNVEKASTDTMRVERDAAKALIERLIKWDSDFPVDSHNGYAGLKELDRIIADGKALTAHSGDEL